MAASSSIFNFLSFLLPSKAPSPPPPPPPKIPPPHTLSPHPSSNSNLSLSTQSHSPRTRDGVVDPLISSSTDISSVVCPSLAYANTLFFKSAYNVQVIVDENEPEEKLLNRFRREVMRAGVIQESKRRRFFENKQDEKKRKSREAAKRNKRRRNYSRAPVQDKQEVSNSKKDNDEEDNWELPEGDLP